MIMNKDKYFFSSKTNIFYTVKNNLCTGCGVCEDICPKHCITIQNKNGDNRPVLDAVQCLGDKCGRCLKVCPGVGVHLAGMSKQLFLDDTVKEDNYVGRYISLYTGYSNDYDIRYHSASGGMVSQLLIWLLEKNYIDGAVVTAFDNTKPLMVRSYIAKSRDEIIMARSSKYGPVSLAGAISAIKKEKASRFVVVGLPCHIHAFRKAEYLDGKLKEKVVGYFGILCSSGRSFNLTDYVLKERNLNREKLAYFAYRDNGCLGEMVAIDDNKTYREDFQSYYHPLRSFFLPRRCLFCVDHYAELADVSFGDIHIAPYSEDKVGVNAIVVRSDFWKSKLAEAALDGVVSLNDLDVEVLKKSQKMAYKKKGRNMAFLKLNEKMGRIVPQYDVEENVSVSLSVLLDYVQNRIQQFIGSHRNLWWTIKFLKSKPPVE